MTEAEAREFFEAVKGKRIRWSTWGRDRCFITDVLDAHMLRGTTIWTSGSSHSDSWFACNGFKPDLAGAYWQLIEPTDATKPEPPTMQFQNLVCTCCPVHGIQKAFSNEKGVST